VAIDVDDTGPQAPAHAGPALTDLHVTSPMMEGPAVLHVQQALHQLGYAPGELDGIYGPTTAGAVRAFQHDHHLTVDGVVGPNTRAVLDEAPLPPHPALLVRKASALGRLALASAVKELGKKEAPPNSNLNPFGEWFGVNGVPWCNIFVSYCFVTGAHYTICSGFKGAGVYAKGCTYVPTTEAWLKSTGMWQGRTEPMPGDIAIYNWNGGPADHIGIVEEYLGNGQFHAIEGNTAVGNDSNGGQVMRRVRSITNVEGFGRVTQ
jgi:hypothetical protein